MSDKKVKEFDAVKMSLDIKQLLYEENKGLTIAEYLKKLNAEAKKSNFWKTKKISDPTGKRKHNFTKSRKTKI